MAILAAACVAGLPAGASAASISSAGPLSVVEVGTALACQLRAGDQSGEFFGGDPGACGTFVSVPGASGPTVYGPPSLPAGPSPSPFTPVSQQTASSGSTQSISTTVTVTPSLTLTETDSYTPGDLFYTTEMTLANTDGAPVQGVVLYHGFDCFLGNSDEGYGFAGSRAVACTKTANNSPAGAALTLTPITADNDYFEGAYSSNWSQIMTGAALPNTCDCGQLEDNGASLSWTKDVPAGSPNAPGTVSVSLRTSISASAPSATTQAPPQGAAGSTVTVGGSVAANGRPTTYWIQYGTDPALAAGTTETTHQPISSTGFADIPVSGDLPGLADNTTYYYRVVANNDIGTTSGDIQSFTISPPAATTGSAFPTGTSSATFDGTVTPNGKPTSYWVEYSTDGSFGSRTAAQDAGSGFDPVSVTSTASDLVAGATYRFRVVAKNDLGTVTGATQTFTFQPSPGPPTAVTGPASAVSQTAATLGGSVAPNGGDTTWWFEYGSDATYGTETAHQPASGTGFAAQPVSSAIAGLAPSTTYHYRVVAINPFTDTPVTGADMTFTTAAPPSDTTPTTPTTPVTPPPPGPPELPPPEIGQTANVVPESGTVLVKLPAGTSPKRAKALGLTGAATGFIPLAQASHVPMGSTFDTTHGQLGMTTAATVSGSLQDGHFSGGQFKVTQSTKNPLTTLSMGGGGLSGCGTRVPSGGSGKPCGGGQKPLAEPLLERPRALQHPRPQLVRHRARHPVDDEGHLRRNAHEGEAGQRGGA